MQIENRILPEMWVEIMNRCSDDTLYHCQFVSQQFCKWVQNSMENQHKENFIGPVRWLKYGEEIKNCPPIPLKLISELNKSENKALLTLIPEKIENEKVSLDLNSFSTLLCKNSRKKELYSSPLSEAKITKELIEKYKAPKTHWALLYKDVEMETRNQCNDKQVKMIEDSGYQVPHLIDAVVAITMYNKEAKQLIFPFLVEGFWTNTRVQERNQDNIPIIVGGFYRDRGPKLFANPNPGQNFGIARAVTLLRPSEKMIKN